MASKHAKLLVLERQVLAFWFGSYYESRAEFSGALAKKWFVSTPELDAQIKDLFEQDIIRLAASKEELSTLAETDTGALSAIILFDQFPRNIYRNTSGMFQYDHLALQLARNIVERPSFESSLRPVMKVFAFLPFEHSEDSSSQKRCLELFRMLLESSQVNTPEYEMIKSGLDYAKTHASVIERFGRFPHRNRALSRQSSPEELQYLQNGGETFGVK